MGRRGAIGRYLWYDRAAEADGALPIGPERARARADAARVLDAAGDEHGARKLAGPTPAARPPSDGAGGAGEGGAAVDEDPGLSFSAMTALGAPPRLPDLDEVS